MFEVSVLISLIISLLVFFFTLYITLKKELDDLKNDSDKSSNTQKIQTREKAITYLKIVTLVLLFFVLMLYFFPTIINAIINNEFRLNLSAYGVFLQNLFPFKKGFFTDIDFTISYVTGIILSISCLVIWYYRLKKALNPTLVFEFTFLIILLILLGYGLIWANYYISLFLIYCIVNFFILLSIVFNLIIYTLICAFISYIIYCLE